MNRNDNVDVLAGAAARARQDLNSVTSLRPVPALPSQSRRHGRARGRGWRRLPRSPAFASVAVALLVLGILVGIRLVGDGGSASPRPGDLLQPGAELGSMRLIVANPLLLDTELWSYCEPPIMIQPGIHSRNCEVLRWPRLMIGNGSLSTTPESLEQEWRAQQWELYLDGRQVDLAAFGTLPDRRYFEPVLGTDVWLRLWAVTVVNLAPGQHTLRYVAEQSPAGDATVGTFDITWTITVTQ